MAGRENADAVYLHEFSWPPNELNFKIDDDPMFSRGHVKIEFPHFLIKHGRLEFLYASYVGSSQQKRSSPLPNMRHSLIR